MTLTLGSFLKSLRYCGQRGGCTQQRQQPQIQLWHAGVSGLNATLQHSMLVVNCLQGKSCILSLSLGVNKPSKQSSDFYQGKIRYQFVAISFLSRSFIFMASKNMFSYKKRCYEMKSFLNHTDVKRRNSDFIAFFFLR